MIFQNEMRMYSYLFVIFVLSIIYTSGNVYEEYEKDTVWNGIENNISESLETKALIRRKRFIIFPEGSSFQLVFCTQNHGYLQLGNIIWFGTTAALAWELPTDPSAFDIIRKSKRVYENRRNDKHIYYLNEDGKVIGKVPYHRKPLVNPAFAKRSVDAITTKALSKKKMHDMQKNANYLNSLHEKSIEFHRSGKKILYAKVENVLQALGWNGRQCVLRMLCECSQQMEEQGTFLEELVRATFTLPKGREFEADHQKRYDEARGSYGRCATLYPGCEHLHRLQLYDIE